MTNNPTARVPNSDRLTSPGVLASIPTRQDTLGLCKSCTDPRAHARTHARTHAHTRKQQT